MRKKEIMHKTTILFIVTISTILSFSTPLLSQKNLIDAVIAVVGDNAIFKPDVEY